MTTVGVLGSGQLGSMLALAGYPFGLRFRFLATADSEGRAELGEHFRSDLEEPSLAHFARGLDVVTYEFENFPAAVAESIAERVPVYPPPLALAVAQDRLREKEFLRGLDLAVTPYAAIDSWRSLGGALETVGLPAVMKLRHLGYDGHGQVVVRTESAARDAWLQLGQRGAVLERWVPFARELSLIAIRGRGGETRFYPLVENRHIDGILRTSLAPAPGVASALKTAAECCAARILTALSYVGVLTVEFFEHDGRLIANEIAPRVHNSGHWTIEGAETSQFENHLRAILGLPLGSTRPVGHSALVNLIGTVPDTDAILQIPDTHLHVYGKAPRPRRKLGHVTARVDRPELLEDRLRTIERLVAAPLKSQDEDDHNPPQLPRLPSGA